MNYNAGFDVELSYGQVNEEKLKRARLEVKTDRHAHRTRNLFIEVYSRGKPSGLTTTTATHWVYYIDDCDTGILIDTNRLKEMVRAYNWRWCYGGDNNSSVGVLLPLDRVI